MRKSFFTFVLLFTTVLMSAQDKTLRVDYILSGTDKTQEIAVHELLSFDGWAGRRVNMDSAAVKGNGQVIMKDKASGRVLYRQSFSTLFQEWQTTEEATRMRRSFEFVCLFPMPEAKAEITFELYGFKGGVSASLTHEVDPSDILIRQLEPVGAEHRFLHRGGSSEECIDVAILAEGYAAADMEQFFTDAQSALKAIMKHEPFGQYRDRFNFIAVALESEDSGVSIPRDGVWKSTALGSHYDTFYSDRYLTTSRIRMMNDKLCGIPYEHIIILVNAETYGGGGIYNSYTISTARHATFEPVIVHEFGHGFGGLADEYYYDDQFVEYYYPDIEPWEQNITTLYDFSSKWDDMLPKVVEIPTAPVEGNIWEKFHEGVSMESMVGVYEGGGYQSKGVYRPFPDCRMNTNPAESFCPVCQRAIARMIEFYTEEK